MLLVDAAVDVAIDCNRVSATPASSAGGRTTLDTCSSTMSFATVVPVLVLAPKDVKILTGLHCDNGPALVDTHCDSGPPAAIPADEAHVVLDDDALASPAVVAPPVAVDDVRESPRSHGSRTDQGSSALGPL